MTHDRTPEEQRQDAKEQQWYATLSPQAKKDQDVITANRKRQDAERKREDEEWKEERRQQEKHRLWELRMDEYFRTLPTRYRKYTFKTLKTTDGNRAAVDVALTLKLGENLYIHGPAGNGKTHLAVAAGFHLITEGQHVEFHGVVDLFNRIRNSFSGDGWRPNLLRPDVLILDDLGKIKPTEFVYQEFYGALEARWANEKTTIITANHRASHAADSLAQDPESAAAILSRMASGHVVEVTGRDERLQR